MRTLNILIAILFMSLPAVSIAADNEPPFEFAGTIDRIDSGSEVIVVGDMLFRFSPGMTVLDTGHHVVDRKKLRTGMKVGINTYRRGEQSDAIRYVHEVQILHSSVNIEKLMDDN